MSLKYHAAQDGPNRYRLGKTGDMQCDVLAFLSPDLYEATDEGLWTVSNRKFGVYKRRCIMLSLCHLR